MHAILFDKIAQTVGINEITINGERLIPEPAMRKVHLWYRDFIQFHNNLEEIISLYNSWKTPLITRFTVKGGWAIPKAPLISAQLTVESLENYARWFWSLADNSVISCIFTQNQNNDVIMETTESEYTGMCTMDVEFAVKNIW